MREGRKTGCGGYTDFLCFTLHPKPYTLLAS